MRKQVLLLIIFIYCLNAQAQWIASLPANIQAAIHWAGDHEEGNLNDWTLEQYQYPGGGIFNTGGTDVSAVAILSSFLQLL